MIRDLFTEQIMAMFKEETKRDGETLARFCEALKKGDGAEVERLFNAYLGRTISIRDTFVRRPLKENLPSGKATTKGPKRQDPSVCFYHGILLGILGFKNGWYIRSNKEAGDGYSDIQIQVEDEDIGIIIEVKYAEKGSYDVVCKGALEQIRAGGYAAELKALGFQKILRYGIACFRKKCKVVVEKEAM